MTGKCGSARALLCFGVFGFFLHDPGRSVFGRVFTRSRSGLGMTSRRSSQIISRLLPSSQPSLPPGRGSRHVFCCRRRFWVRTFLELIEGRPFDGSRPSRPTNPAFTITCPRFIPRVLQPTPIGRHITLAHTPPFSVPSKLACPV